MHELKLDLNYQPDLSSSQTRGFDSVALIDPNTTNRTSARARSRYPSTDRGGNSASMAFYTNPSLNSTLSLPNQPSNHPKISEDVGNGLESSGNYGHPELEKMLFDFRQYERNSRERQSALQNPPSGAMNPARYVYSRGLDSVSSEVDTLQGRISQLQQQERPSGTGSDSVPSQDAQLSQEVATLRAQMQILLAQQVASPGRAQLPTNTELPPTYVS